MSATLAYIAGLIDGEGYISASKNSRTKGSYTIVLSISMCRREGVDLCARAFGGKAREKKRKTITGRSVYIWTIHSKTAEKALTKLLPFLRVRNRVAKLVLRMQKLIHEPTHCVTRLTEREILKRDRIYKKIKLAILEG